MEATHEGVEHLRNRDIHDGMGRGRYHSNKPCNIIMMDTPGCNMQSQSVQSNTAWKGEIFKKRKGESQL